MDLKNIKTQIIIILIITVVILACYIVYNRFFKAKKQKTVMPTDFEDAEIVEHEPKEKIKEPENKDIKIPKKIQIFEKYRNRDYSLREASKRFKTSRRGFLFEYNEYLKNYDIKQY